MSDIKIFISHASEDKEFVDLLVKTLENTGIPASSIYYTSEPGYDIPVGRNFLNDIKLCLQSRPYFICVHSRYYYKSPICLNEMGAEWVLDLPHTSILLPGMKKDEMKGVITNHEILIDMKMEEKELKDKLKQMIESLVLFLEIPSDSLHKETDKIIEGFIRDSLKIDFDHIPKAVLINRASLGF